MSGPRILTLDIENSPPRVDAWGLYNQNIGLPQVHDPGHVICFAAKWHDQKKIIFASEYHNDHGEMVDLAHQLLSEADWVVTFNGDRHDLPHLNREFLQARLAPPAPYKSIDLYKVARRNFRFLSNRLAFITEQLDLSGKLAHTGHQLWVDCMNGDPDAWRLMRRYNKRDVSTTEELYDELLPWIKGINAGLYGTVGAVCPKCASGPMQKRGHDVTSAGKYQRYQCQNCGGWSRGGKRVEGVDLR